VGGDFTLAGGSAASAREDLNIGKRLMLECAYERKYFVPGFALPCCRSISLPGLRIATDGCGGVLAVGGNFTTAGGKAAGHVAKADTRVDPVFTSSGPSAAAAA